MLTSFPPGGLAVVLGASGGIGTALLANVQGSGAFQNTVGTSRNPPDGAQKGINDGSIIGLDLTQEASIAALADQVKASGLELRFVLDATGYLHGPQGSPERSWRELDPAALGHQFAINATGPALVMKHLLPLFPRKGKAVFATISAKVGSIGDNKLGGWYGYRAAKAALNQLVKTASIELARKRPEAICLALHPGTVETPLSDPFAKSGLKLQTPQQSAASLLDVIDTATPAQSGLLMSYDGAVLPP